MTIALAVDVETVTWSDWGYQTDCEDEVHRDEVRALGTLTFKRAEYEAVLRQALGRFDVAP